MIAFCNAKINIGLRVLGKRPDGFHELESFFLPVPLRDALEITDGKGDGLRIFQSGMPIPKGKNICAKAYDLLNEQFTLPPLDLHLLKSIPVGAGLGGGSSNAAAMLHLLNDTLMLGLCHADLLKFAEQLGSDVPFFLLNKPCLVRGRGEQLEPFDVDFDELWLQVVNPGIHCSTADIFGRHQAITGTESLEVALKRPIEEWRETVFNDLEKAAFSLYPKIGKLKEGLYANGALYAAMSGSGSSVFGLFAQEPAPYANFSSWTFHL